MGLRSEICSLGGKRQAQIWVAGVEDLEGVRALLVRLNTGHLERVDFFRPFGGSFSAVWSATIARKDAFF